MTTVSLGMADMFDVITLQLIGGGGMHTNPFIVWPVVIALLIIVILGVRVYIMDKRKQH